MSGPAMHRVLVNGPIEHHHLILVLLNVADWADTDIESTATPSARWLSRPVAVSVCATAGRS